MSWNSATASNGAHVLTAVARDGVGNATTSAQVHVTVNNVDATLADRLDIGAGEQRDASPVRGATVSATASDNVGVVWRPVPARRHDADRRRGDHGAVPIAWDDDGGGPRSGTR